MNPGRVNSPGRIYETDARQTGKLVIGGVHEGGIHRAIGKQAGEAEAMRSVEGGKRPAHINGAVQLRCNGIDRIIRARAGVEAGVKRPILIQAHNMVLRTAVDVGEITAREKLVIELPGQRPHHVIGTRARIKRGVESAIRIQPRNVGINLP